MFPRNRFHACADNPIRGRQYPVTQRRHSQTRFNAANTRIYGDAHDPSRTYSNSTRHSNPYTIPHPHYAHRSSCKSIPGWENRVRNGRATSHGSANSNASRYAHACQAGRADADANRIPHRYGDTRTGYSLPYRSGSTHTDRHSRAVPHHRGRTRTTGRDCLGGQPGLPIGR